jgi:hypothetical protein
LERICAIKDYIFNEFLWKFKILFRRLRSCFNIFVEFIYVRFSKFFVFGRRDWIVYTFSHA